MKKLLFIVTLVALTFTGMTVSAQDTTASAQDTSMKATAPTQADKLKRPSPPATATATTDNGVTITINYSQPSLKGRTIGKDVEPMKGKVWRAGANEATTFEVNKDVTINGQKLPAGKYSLFMIDNGDTWTLIFNKNWDFWGTEYEKNKDQDILHVDVPASKPDATAEKLTYTIDKSGKVTMMWGDKQVSFDVQ